MVSGLSADGAVGHGTPVHWLPLPAPLPGRVAPTFNGNGQYRLPDPLTGKLTSYTRASTVAKTLEDTYMLDLWSKRMMLLGLYRHGASILEDVHHVVEEHLGDAPEYPAGPVLARELRAPLNRLSETAVNAGGATMAAEFGTAVHAWCEYVDLGLCHLSAVPEQFRPWVRNHRRTLARNGLTVDPLWTERIVLNTQYGIAGTLDRLYWDHTGRLFLGDIKTSKGMDYSWLYFAIQLAIYHGSSHVLSLDGTTWEPMPALDPGTALISHLPSVDAEASRIVPLSMEFGAQALHTAVTVRRMRRRAEESAQDVRYTVGSMSTEETRRYLAQYLVETSETEADMALIWEEYQDVWDDALTNLGWATLQSANANANA